MNHLIDARYLKQNINPKDLAIKLLGEPTRRQGNTFWYKSPFRAEERTASFEVTDKSFHDFGTSEHFDVIGFAQRYWHCSFKEAVKMLQRMYGLTDNEYENEQIRAEIERHRREMAEYRAKIEAWFKEFCWLVEDAWAENTACINALEYDMSALPILYDRDVFLGCLREDILNANTFTEKERFKKEITKEGLPEWMKNQKRYSLIFPNKTMSQLYQRWS